MCVSRTKTIHVNGATAFALTRKNFGEFLKGIFKPVTLFRTLGSDASSSHCLIWFWVLQPGTETRADEKTFPYIGCLGLSDIWKRGRGAIECFESRELDVEAIFFAQLWESSSAFEAIDGKSLPKSHFLAFGSGWFAVSTLDLFFDSRTFLVTTCKQLCVDGALRAVCTGDSSCNFLILKHATELTTPQSIVPYSFARMIRKSIHALDRIC